VDRQIAAYVRGLMETHGLVEYYLVDDPPGLLMLKSGGEIWRLAILDEAQMLAQADLARSFGAPPVGLRRLQSGEAILFLPGPSPEDYFGDEDFPWEEHIHAASRLKGQRRDWWVAIWRDAPADVDFDPASASYDAYLGTL